MNPTRLQQLQQFLKEEPNDPFLLYAIATEYLNAEDFEQARHFFEILLHEHEHYIATYYHAAQLYADLDLPELAEQTYKKGIALCEVHQELKTLRELKQAYQNFQFEQD